jgi:hypothetical protein
MNRFEIIDPTLCADWDETIASNREHSFFHSSNWAGVLRDSYSYKPLYFTGREGHTISALIPVMEVRSFLTGNRGVSIPFTDYCEPIAANRGCFSSLFDEISQYGKKAGWKYLELRGGNDLLGGSVTSQTFLRHVLPLDDREPELFKRLNPATRRNIRKAADSGVAISFTDSEKDLDAYYRLHCRTRKRHGVPPQPLRFFKAIYKNVISKGKGFTVLGVFEGRPISGAVYFQSGRKAIYKFGASDLRYQGLRAANLVMWEAIRYFSKNGFDELCFGRTDPANVGLIRFKAAWGAREESLPYYRYDLKKEAFVKGTRRMGGLGERILRNLPVPVLRIAGELLYGHLG